MTAAITSFRGQYEFLSNFHRMPDGSTLEHRYQAEKVSTNAEAEWILSAPSPGEAKGRGRQVLLRPDWEEVKRDVMLRLLRMKFADHEQYRTLLLATGDAELIEGNTWHDQYWGSCACPMHYGVEGQNWLGELLMQVREELRGRELTMILRDREARAGERFVLTKEELDANQSGNTGRDSPHGAGDVR